MIIQCDDNPYSNVPGGDLLDGKAWGGVTGADFVQRYDPDAEQSIEGDC